MPIRDDVVLGEGTVVHRPELVNLYGCRLGAECRVGPFVEIQEGAVVGDRCKIESHTFVCGGVVIEDDVFVGHGVQFTNDRHPRASASGRLLGTVDWVLEPTRVRRGASIGSGAVILPGLVIGESPRGRRRGRHARRAGGGGGRGQPGARPAVMIRVGLIGFGYWGTKLARNLTECPAFELADVCDRDAARLSLLAQLHPGLRGTTDAGVLIDDPSLEALVIATPAASHAPLARAALAAGKHVLVEKPLALAVTEAEELVALARRHSRVLAVDHTFVYAPVLARIAEEVAAPDFGRFEYYDSLRTNLSRVEPDCPVIWDLAAHDCAILDLLRGGMPRAVSALGRGDVVSLTLHYRDGAMARVLVDGAAPAKLRRIVIRGERKLLFWDDLAPQVKLAVTRAAPTSEPDLRAGYTAGPTVVPQIAPTEALRNLVEDFASAIASGRKPRSDGEMGLRVVRVLTAATASLAAGGALVGTDAAAAMEDELLPTGTGAPGRRPRPGG